MNDQSKAIIEVDGRELECAFHEPKEQLGPVPAVVVCKQVLESAQAPEQMFELLCRHLCIRGMSALVLPAETGGMDISTSIAARVAFMKSSFLAGLKFLTRQPGVELDAFGGFGFGLGGLIAAMAAAESDLIKALALVAPVFDAASLTLGPGLASSSENSSQVCDVSQDAREEMGNGLSGLHAGTISPACSSILLVHGNRDQVVPLAHSFQYRDGARAAGKRLKLVTLEGCDHSFKYEFWQWIVVDETCRWLLASLNSSCP